MKGMIKKFSVIVGISIVALLIMVGMALAGPSAHDPHYYIDGGYAVTGFSSCDPANPGIMEADYTFRHDGTGSIKGVGRNIMTQGQAVVGSGAIFTGEFTYTITKEGRIEFEYPFPPGGLKVDFGSDGTIDVTMDGGPSHGVISPDHKTITISCGYPIPLYPINPDTGKKICDCPVWCITTLSGMRIR